MFSTKIILSALLFLFELNLVAGKAILSTPHGFHSRRQDLGHQLRRTALNAIEDRLFSWASQIEDVVQVSKRDTFTTPGSTTTLNTTTTIACQEALAAMPNVTNPAGVAACYNLLFLNNITGVFQAELRLYQMQPSSGAFAGIQANSIMVGLDYPDAAISSTTKTKRAVEARQDQSAPTELQQFDFFGQIDTTLDLSKLQGNDLMALTIPEINLEGISPSTQSPVNMNLTSSSIVFFVAGVFAGESAKAAAAAANPTAAAAAAAKASVFVIPGKTLGIFPIGLIVTMSWTFLFILAFGLGTIGRITHRNSYRSRMANAGRTGRK